MQEGAEESWRPPPVNLDKGPGPWQPPPPPFPVNAPQITQESRGEASASSPLQPSPASGSAEGRSAPEPQGSAGWVPPPVAVSEPKGREVIAAPGIPALERPLNQESAGRRPWSAKQIALVLVITGLVGGGVWLNAHRAEVKAWVQQVRVQCFAWLKNPSESDVTSGVVSQLADFLPNTDEANLAITRVAIKHQRGKTQATWTGIAKVWLTASRYLPVDWGEQAAKAGFDAAAYNNSVRVCSTLPPNDAPRKPDETTPVLLGEVQPSGQTVEIPLHGAVLLNGEIWSVTVEELASARLRIGDLLNGQVLSAFGKGACAVGSPEATHALAAFVEERKKFIAEVQTARQQAEQQNNQRIAEKKAGDEQAAAGLVQAGWHALEQLSGYLNNIAINSRLIELANQQGNEEKAALYRSYASANNQNIQDASSSYIQAMRDLSKLDPAIRRNAVEQLRGQLGSFSPPWKLALVKRMSEDAESLPDFNNAAWVDDILRIRQQK